MQTESLKTLFNDIPNFAIQSTNASLLQFSFDSSSLIKIGETFSLKIVMSSTFSVLMGRENSCRTNSMLSIKPSLATMLSFVLKITSYKLIDINFYSKINLYLNIGAASV